MQKVFNQPINNQIEIYCINNQYINDLITDDSFFESINLLSYKIKKDRFINILDCLLPKEKNWTNEYANRKPSFMPTELENLKHWGNLEVNGIIAEFKDDYLVSLQFKISILDLNKYIQEFVEALDIFNLQNIIILKSKNQYLVNNTDELKKIVCHEYQYISYN